MFISSGYATTQFLFAKAFIQPLPWKSPFYEVVAVGWLVCWFVWLCCPPWTRSALMNCWTLSLDYSAPPRESSANSLLWPRWGTRLYWGSVTCPACGVATCSSQLSLFVVRLWVPNWSAPFLRFYRTWWWWWWWWRNGARQVFSWAYPSPKLPLKNEATEGKGKGCKEKGIIWEQPKSAAAAIAVLCRSCGRCVQTLIWCRDWGTWEPSIKAHPIQVCLTCSGSSWDTLGFGTLPRKRNNLSSHLHMRGGGARERDMH